MPSLRAKTSMVTICWGTGVHWARFLSWCQQWQWASITPLSFDTPSRDPPHISACSFNFVTLEYQYDAVPLNDQFYCSAITCAFVHIIVLWFFSTLNFRISQDNVATFLRRSGRFQSAFFCNYLGIICFVLFWCSEREILHEEISLLELVNDRLKTRIGELEEDVHKMRAALRKTSDDAGPATNAEVRILWRVDCLILVYCINLDFFLMLYCLNI